MDARGREGLLDSRGALPGKRERRIPLKKTAHISILTTILAIIVLFVSAWKRHNTQISLFPDSGSSSNKRDTKSALQFFSTIDGTPKKNIVSPAIPTTYQRKFDLTGVQEHLTTIRQDWRVVVNNFMDESEMEGYSARKIREHYHTDINNVQNTCMLVSIKNGNVSFTEKYQENRHSRASSVKYILQKIVKEKGASLAGATFMVMLSDGHRPMVPTLGSARHWKSWGMMIPVPLGNSRGGNMEWGTPIEGWDSYIDRTIVSSHVNYSWNEKFEKALFRGSLSMQKYKLGSCNQENRWRCTRASKWNEVNRGVLYERTKSEPDLFDIGFTQLKPKEDGPAEQLQDAPELVPRMKFQDFQKYKYILNVGNNQDWAERLRSLLFMNSVVAIHQAETQEFFTPLLRPWVHYIPITLYMDDLVSNIKWALDNDQYAQQIVRNQNAFADRYITERAMQQYWEVALEEFSSRQAKAASVGTGSNH